MSFSQHKAGADDGHWQSRYLGKDGVIRRDREAYDKIRCTFFESKKGGSPWSALALAYRDALFAYASTVYSARMFRPLWAPRQLVRLVGEIDHLAMQIAFTFSQKECLMAFQMYLSRYDTWWTGEVGRMQKAAALGREILADDATPLATRLLTLARMSNIDDFVEDEGRRYYRHEVRVALAGLVLSEEFFGLDQDWKTVCRVAMLIGAWEYVDLAHQHDRSRDIWLRAWAQPGFVLYKLKKGIFGK